MNCLKCGRETDQSFCEQCRKEMERYPVKPGTIVLLPRDRSASYTRRSANWRLKRSTEDQIANQKRTIRRLSGAVAAMAMVVICMGFAIFRILRSTAKPPVGQNYSTVTKATEDVTDPTTGAEDGEEANVSRETIKTGLTQ